MTALIAGLGMAVAVAAAVRSTWSPCGLSMLSTLTPLAERSRGHRYGATAVWFIAGATLGGATLGLVAGALAIGVRALSLSEGWTLGLAAAAALVGATSDIRPRGLHLPTHGRQVDELWLGRYRRWVYASGFGWQIGTGVATYIMTAAVYLVVVLGALTASPGLALGLATLFGLLRGLAVLASAHLTSPEALYAFHRRFDAWAPASRQLAIVVQLLVALTAAWAVGPVAGVVAVAAVVGLAVLDVTTGRARQTHASPAVPSPTA